jgi:hypothetical protein
MSVDVVDLRSFYASPMGDMARRLVGRVVDRFWGPLGGLRVLGLGYATPYLDGVRALPERTLAFMPETQGVVNWPATGLTASALVDPTMMPLPGRLGRPRPPGARDREQRKPGRTPLRGLAHPDARRAHHPGRAEPARAVVPGGHDALRPGQALQPLAASSPDARTLFSPEAGPRPSTCRLFRAGSFCAPPSPGSALARPSPCPSPGCTCSKPQSSSTVRSRCARPAAPRAAHRCWFRRRRPGSAVSGEAVFGAQRRCWA